MEFEIVPAPEQELKVVPQPKPTGPTPSIAQRLLKGAKDPFDGAAQLLSHALPSGLVNSLNQANNWAADHGFPVSRISPAGLDAQLRLDEADYQGRRAQNGDPGFDWARLGGNVLSPATLVPMGATLRGAGALSRLAAARAPTTAATLGNIANGTTLGGRVAQGSILGAEGSLTAPVYGSNYGDEKGTQTLLGTALGPVAPMVGKMASRMISPDISSAARQFVDAGGRPSMGQYLGGAWNTTEQKLTSIPLVGDAVNATRRRAFRDFNIQAMQKAAEPLRELKYQDLYNENIANGLNPAEASKKAMREAIQWHKDTFSTPGYTGMQQFEGAYQDAYDSALNRLPGGINGTPGFQLDGQYATDLGNLRQLVTGLQPEYQAKFNGLYKKVVDDQLSPNGSFAADVFKTHVDSPLGSEAHDAMMGTDVFQKDYGRAVKQLQAIIRDNMKRSSPEARDAMALVDDSYANYARLRDAMGYAANTGRETATNDALQATGNAGEVLFTPEQLYRATVAAGNASKNQKVTGTARMQDYAGDMKNLLGTTVPNSGTADRYLFDAALEVILTLAAPHSGNPVAEKAMLGSAAGLGAGAVAYSPLVQSALVRATNAGTKVLPSLVKLTGGSPEAVSSAVQDVAPYLSGALPEALGQPTQQ